MREELSMITQTPISVTPVILAFCGRLTPNQDPVFLAVDSTPHAAV
jgi:hypothetical protein